MAAVLCESGQRERIDREEGGGKGGGGAVDQIQLFNTFSLVQLLILINKIYQHLKPTGNVFEFTSF